VLPRRRHHVPARVCHAPGGQAGGAALLAPGGQHAAAGAVGGAGGGAGRGGERAAGLAGSWVCRHKPCACRLGLARAMQLVQPCCAHWRDAAAPPPPAACTTCSRWAATTSGRRPRWTAAWCASSRATRRRPSTCWSGTGSCACASRGAAWAKQARCLPGASPAGVLQCAPGSHTGRVVAPPSSLPEQSSHQAVCLDSRWLPGIISPPAWSAYRA
jgi:hypothetical protein